MTESALSDEIRNELDRVLFGDQVRDSTDRERWKAEGFLFATDLRAPESLEKENEIEEIPEFGLIQSYGGPCGILAPIQAFILNYLLFQADSPQGEQLDSGGPSSLKGWKISRDVKYEALAYALTLALRQASQGSNSTSAGLDHNVIRWISPNQNLIHSCDINQPILPMILHEAKEGILAQPGSVLRFVNSLLLTRGIARIRQDMDDLTQPLVQRFGHCSQELVNLLLCGRSVSNVFDGDRSLGSSNDSIVLRGIPTKTCVGFLSQLEALQYCTVGEHYKFAVVPIWVIGSTSHYTVLFSTKKGLADLSPEKQFEKNLKSAFSELDQDDNGFIRYDQLPVLLAKLGRSEWDTATITSQVDRDGLNLLLYGNLLPVLSSLFSSTQPKQLNIPQQEWSCSACTLINEAGRTRCQVCETPARVQTSSEVEQFVLYHYNGIRNEKGAKPLCIPIHITINDTGISQGIGQGRGIEEVIQTRWPDALASFEMEPKII